MSSWCLILSRCARLHATAVFLSATRFALRLTPLRAGPRVRVPRGGGCHGGARRSGACAADAVRPLTRAAQGGPLRVRVYALAEPGLQVPGSVWDYGAWRAAHLDAFVRMCADFSAREFPAETKQGQ